MTAQLPARLRAYPMFWALVSILALVAVAATVDAVRQASRLRTVAWRREQLRIELLSPQARPELVAAAGAALDHAREQLRVAKAAWPGSSSGAESASVDRLAAFAELTGFVERMQTRATAAGVAVARDERFGFAQHAQVAPEGEIASTVLAQRRVVERVLAALFAAQPERLSGVWRENPRAEEAARDSEWYALPAGRSVRVPGLVESRMVRVAFVGSTVCLRRFLNRLAAVPALVVREVAVMPAEERGERDGRVRQTGRDRHRFSVGIEAVAVAGGTKALGEAEAVTPDGAEAVWREPAAGPGNEVFAISAAEYVPEQRTWRRTGGAVAKVDEADLALVEIQRVSYRWRLVGHVGESTAVFEDGAARRSVLVAVGGRDPASGIVLERLEFERAGNGGRIVWARLRDPAERDPVVLTTGGGDGFARPVAVLRVRGRTETVTVAEGASVVAGENRYVVGPITAEPASVVLSRAAADGAVGAPVRLRVAAK